MNDQGLPKSRGIANSSDYFEVSICFQDWTINHLFAELLKVRGVKTTILERIEDFATSSKIVTEPQFYGSLDESQRRRCLIVGNKDALKNLKECISLSRPLTEDKIEEAISQFLMR